MLCYALVYAQPACGPGDVYSARHDSSDSEQRQVPRCSAKGARLAVDVIQYEPAMERAIHHACGNSLVCDTMEVARYVCYEKGQGGQRCARYLRGRYVSLVPEG